MVIFMDYLGRAIAGQSICCSQNFVPLHNSIQRSVKNIKFKEALYGQPAILFARQAPAVMSHIRCCPKRESVDFAAGSIGRYLSLAVCSMCLASSDSGDKLKKIEMLFLLQLCHDRELTRTAAN
jgi:hypothetical protein